MAPPCIQLKILLPFRVFAERDGVLRIVAETPAGSFGIWPRRLDGVAALAPGIFTFQVGGEPEEHVAVDEGILVKAGFNVTVSVRNAVGGVSLDRLQRTVDEQFLRLDEQERATRTVLAKLESRFFRRFQEASHGPRN